MEDEFVVGEKGKAECTQVHNNNRKAFRGEEQFFCALCDIYTALPEASKQCIKYYVRVKCNIKPNGGVALLH